MIFLTEEDVRQRCELGQGGEFRLQAGERLTPAATELLRSRNCRVILPGQCTVEAAPVEEAKPAAPAAEAAPAAPAAEQASFPDGTYLDANTVVSKSHPRIFLRGKLDTLISSTVLVQTGFDGNNKLPAVLRNGLSDINVWLWQILQAEVSGEAVPAQALAQVCELTWQLRGQAGERQVAGAKVGITANQGLFGHGSSVIVKR